MKEPENQYGSDDEIRALAARFEDCTLPDEDFDHRAHLAVAVWYLSAMPAEEAADRMREGLMRFLAHYDVDPQKYNETITQFWVKRLDRLLSATDSSLPLVERANRVIEQAGGSQAIFDYYTRERVFSEEGRTGWVEPDRKSMYEG
ncbi:MAG TPA: hypothetical protein VF717_05430 [Pyrinomonadaceae bacterium]|jgi:hypothetical protein